MVQQGDPDAAKAPAPREHAGAPGLDEADVSDAGAAGVPTRWVALAVLVGMVAASIGWGLRAQGIAAAREAALRDAHEALDLGKVDGANRAVGAYLDADGDAADPAFAWVAGRLEAAKDDLPAARVAFARAAAGAADWPLDQQLSLALHRVAAETDAGSFAQARQLCDDAIAVGASLLDSHLDRDDLGFNAMPTGHNPPTPEPALPLELELLGRRVRVGAGEADALARQGDDVAAIEVLEATEAAVAGRICTGTHRVVCRGVRLQLRDRVLAPLRSARVRAVVAGVLKLARDGKIDEANDRLSEAVEALTVGSRGPAPSEEDRDALRMGTDVGYALQVVAAQRAEEAGDFDVAAQRWATAAGTWGKLQAFDAPPTAAAGPAETPAPMVQPAAAQPTSAAPPTPLPGSVTPTVPIHVLGLGRVQAIQAALDASNSKLDALGAMGVGDTERWQLHQAIASRPRDAALYLEWAVRWIQRSRRPGRDAEQSAADLALARKLVLAAASLQPSAPAARFWGGAIELLDGHPARALPTMEAAWADGGLTVVEARVLAETYDGVGKYAEAAAMFAQIWQLDRDDSAAARRAIATMLLLRQTDAAARLLDAVRAARGDDAVTYEAAAGLALVQDRPQAWASARLALEAATKAAPSDAMTRGQRIATAVAARARAQLAAELRPGEAVLETVFGQSVSAESAHRVGRRTLQCVVLVFTDQRLLVLRWDAERDVGATVRKGAALLRQGLRLGTSLGLETLGLDPATWGPLLQTVRKLAGVPQGQRAEGELDESKAWGALQDASALFVASLDLLDAVQQDVALAPAAPRLLTIDPDEVLAWNLRPVQGERDLWMLGVPAKTGVSLFANDDSRIVVHHDHPLLLRLLLRARLGPAGEGP